MWQIIPNFIGKYFFFIFPSIHLMTKLGYVSNTLIMLFSFSSMEIITDLQKNIMAASFMKQPLLFDKLVNNYINFTNQLSHADLKFVKPVIVDLFQVKSFDLSSIVQNSTYKFIEIKSLQSLNNLQHANIRLLSHAVMQMQYFDNDLMAQCTNCVLTAFQTMSLRIKTICLKYFIKLFRHITKLSPELQLIFVIILNHIADIETRINLWLHHRLIKNEDIVAFAVTVAELLENSYNTKLLQNTSLSEISNVCFKILFVHYREKTSTYDKIMPSVYKLLKTTFSMINDQTLFNKTYELLDEYKTRNEIYSQAVQLLEYVVIHELNEINFKSWQAVNEKVNDLLDQNDGQYQLFLEQIKCLHAIFRTARKIEHNLIIYRQQAYCKKLPSTDLNNILVQLTSLNAKELYCSGNKLFTNLDAIINRLLRKFLTLISTSNLRDASVLILISQTSLELLSLSDCQELDDYLHLQLILFALCPFLRYSELLSSHFQQAFDTIFERIKQTLETPSATNDTWHTSGLDLISNINIEFLSIKNKDIFMDFIMQIFTNMKDNQHQKRIMKISMGLIIQDSYRLEIYENFLRSKMADPKNHLAISEYLKSFLCLSSGSCYIFLINKNNLYEYKIICKSCDLNLTQRQNHANTKEIDTFIDLLMKTNGKFVLSPNITYKFDAHCSDHYFKLFNSADNQIRTNMTECTPALLNHLPKLSFQAVNVNHWLDPMTDNYIEIRLSMSKHMNNIPYLIQVHFYTLFYVQYTYIHV